MVAHHHVAAALEGLVEDGLGDVHADEHSAYRAFGVAHLQPGVVVAFLQIRGRISLYRRDNIVGSHLFILFGEHHLERELVELLVVERSRSIEHHVAA